MRLSVLARCTALLVVALTTTLPLLAADAGSEQTELDRYVQAPDPAYEWKVVSTSRANGLTTFVVDMKSQNWRTKDDVNRTLWQHWLIITKPDKVTSNKAFVFVGGGANGGRPPQGATDVTAKIAAATRSVVAELKMVPNQPLIFHNDGVERTEDDLLGYCWNKVIETGDKSWAPRLPMVKSVVRAMDTITALLASDQGGKATVDQFVIAGGSKRGWTTWLTGVADKRVVAIVPIVIDVVNVNVSMKHHFAAYGFWAPAVGNYVQHGIMAKMDDPRLDGLYEVEDPYSYRQRLTMPKYIVNASGDQFFLPDSSRFYYDDLVGEKQIRYVPNADHGLGKTDALESVAAFYAMIVNNISRPRYSWTFEGEDTIRVTATDKPVVVKLWQATNPNARDFRVETLGKKYTDKLLKSEKNDGVYSAQVKAPPKGWRAFFIELTYKTKTPTPYKVTSAVRVVPDTLPFKDKSPNTPAAAGN